MSSGGRISVEARDIIVAFRRKSRTAVTGFSPSCRLSARRHPACWVQGYLPDQPIERRLGISSSVGLMAGCVTGFGLPARSCAQKRYCVAWLILRPELRELRTRFDGFSSLDAGTGLVQMLWGERR